MWEQPFSFWGKLRNVALLMRLAHQCFAVPAHHYPKALYWMETNWLPSTALPFVQNSALSKELHWGSGAMPWSPILSPVWILDSVGSSSCSFDCGGHSTEMLANILNGVVHSQTCCVSQKAFIFQIQCLKCHEFTALDGSCSLYNQKKGRSGSFYYWSASLVILSLIVSLCCFSVILRNTVSKDIRKPLSLLEGLCFSGFDYLFNMYCTKSDHLIVQISWGEKSLGYFSSKDEIGLEFQMCSALI